MPDLLVAYRDLGLGALPHFDVNIMERRKQFSLTRV
jgi:hypothetical protein